MRNGLLPALVVALAFAASAAGQEPPLLPEEPGLPAAPMPPGPAAPPGSGFNLLPPCPEEGPVLVPAVEPDQPPAPRLPGRPILPARPVSQQRPQLPPAPPVPPLPPLPPGILPVETGPAVRPIAPPSGRPAAPIPASPYSYGSIMDDAPPLPSGPFAPQPAAPGACAPADPCMWASAEYLLWFIRSGGAPPLVQTAPMPAAGQQLDPSAVTTLFPTGGIHSGPLSGVRGTFGFWLGPDSVFGFEGTGFWLQNDQNLFSASGGGSVLARPFFDVARGQPALLQLAVPGTSTGDVRVSAGSRLVGAEANGLARGYDLPAGQVVLLAGFRYLALDEVLRIDDDTYNNVTGSSVSTSDHFRTRNQFYGGQVGARFNWQRGRFVGDATVKAGLGEVYQLVGISGSTTGTLPGFAPAALPVGTLALAPNVGDHTQTRTAFVPEATLRLGYQISPRVLAFVGYNFLYISSVVRPGRQIDPGLNPDFLPFTAPTGATAALRPAFHFHTEDFWAQGITLGMAIRY